MDNYQLSRDRAQDYFLHFDQQAIMDLLQHELRELVGTAKY